MRIRIFALLILGAVMALVAGLATFSYTRQMEGELMSANAAITAFGDTHRVPVLLMDAPRGTRLGIKDFGSVLVPRSQLPTNVLLDLPLHGEEEQTVALADLRAGALLLDISIGKRPAGADFGYLLSRDARALAVMPRNLADFSGLLQPGALVDLFWTRDIGDGISETRLIGNALRILAMPERLPRGAAAPAAPAVTEARFVLEVGVRDAARVLEAGQSGFFSVLPAGGALPAGEDEVAVKAADLRGLPLAVREPAATGGSRVTLLPAGIEVKAPVCRTVLVRGGVRSALEVPC